MDSHNVSSLAAALGNNSITNQAGSVAAQSAMISLSDRVELTAALEEKWRSGHSLDTLQQLSVDCIMKNHEKFLVNDYPECATARKQNPFENLPNAMVQFLLSELALSDFIQFEDNTADITKAYCLVLQLLNPLVLKGQILNFSIFDNFIGPRRRTVDLFNVALFNHMLMNCPKIQSIEIDEMIWRDFVVLPKTKETQIYKMMALKWPNLTSLCQSFAYIRDICGIINDDFLQEISANLPNLRELSISLSSYAFTMKGVKHLSNMKKLEHLKLFISDGINVTDRLVHAAGLTPSLKQFDFYWEDTDYFDMPEFGSSFVDMYGKLYPEKQLSTDKLTIRLRADLLSEWPQCLSVKELEIVHKPDQIFESKNLLDINNLSVRNLTLLGVAPSKIYPLVEKFGAAGLVQLLIEYSPENNGDSENMDAYRIVDACPKLKVLIIKTNGKYEASSSYNVTPKHFQNYEYFSMYQVTSRTPEMSDLYRMYVTGSKKMRHHLEVESEAMIDFFVSLLEEQNLPTCFNQVVKIDINLSGSSVSQQLLDKCLQLIFLLVTRSPYVCRIYFCGLDQDDLDHHKPAKWFFDLLQRLKITLHIPNGVLDLSAGSWLPVDYRAWRERNRSIPRRPPVGCPVANDCLQQICQSFLEELHNLTPYLPSDHTYFNPIVF